VVLATGGVVRKFYLAARRLWLFATCDHGNMVRVLAFPDSTELRFCRGCGRLLSFTDEGTRRHNPHLEYPLLDYTPTDRKRLLAERAG
jgi:hypothetical protein